MKAHFIKRAITAGLKALDGPRGGTRAQMIAGRIDWLRRDRSDPSASKAIIEDEESWLAPALLKAAENGTLGEIADALKNLRKDGEIFNRGRYNVLRAYISLLNFGGPPPTLRKVVTRLKNQCQKNSIPDERVIRDMLKRLNLPLTADKRGRPKN
jgi:hypothetical protein